MDLYLLNKFQSKHENILYVSRILYDLLSHPLEIDELYLKFAKKTNKNLTMEYEEILIKSLCFLYLQDLIKINENKVMRTEK